MEIERGGAEAPAPGNPSSAGQPGVPNRSRGLRWLEDDARGGMPVVLVAAFVLRFWQLGAQSLWTDEATAWTAATLPFARLIDFCLHQDASPPLYYLLTSLALRFGESEAHLRAVSAIASTLLVWVTYRFARLFADRRTATVAAALLALSPFQLVYAQEARTYALVALWTVTAQYFFMRAFLLEKPRAFAPFVAVTALGLYTQSIFVLGLGVQATFIVLTATGRRQLGRWLLGLGIAGALYLPWVIAGLSDSHLEHSHWYVKSPVAHNTMQVLRSVFVTPISLVTPPVGSTLPGLDRFLPRPLGWLLVLGPTALALLAAAARFREPGARGVLARFVPAAVLLPLVAVFALSFWRPLWLPRYFVFLGPMAAMWVALGVRALRPRLVSMATLAMILLVAGYACFRVYADVTKEPWRAMVERIASESDPDSTAVIVPFDPDPFVYYNSRLPNPFKVVPFRHPDVPFHDDYRPLQLGGMYRQATVSTLGFRDVWVVVRSPNSAIRKRAVRFAEQAGGWLRQLETRDSLDSFQGKLRFTHWTNRPSGTADRAEMEAGMRWADSVLALGPPRRERISRPFTRDELFVNPETLAVYLALLADTSFYSIGGCGEIEIQFWNASERLGQLGPGVVPVLIDRITDPDEHVRDRAREALLLATQDDRILARTGGEYLELHQPRAESRASAQEWWTRYRGFWTPAER
ncbi:MAG: hypothetical protein HOP12_00620 [Candidatus Eisenbacteria bacterium]|uniref:Glycosyltransferase RgtA/B/C/D-like domain-containing protein n=1 Tax=Eiseniibacteriota bacterium TaxID=2212470 RepID=A0A849SL65_UNCEI|nr:hypothetical protein [Candidatus Eisenbacteria bacterium]